MPTMELSWGVSKGVSPALQLSAASLAPSDQLRRRPSLPLPRYHHTVPGLWFGRGPRHVEYVRGLWFGRPAASTVSEPCSGDTYARTLVRRRARATPA